MALVVLVVQGRPRQRMHYLRLVITFGCGWHDDIRVTTASGEQVRVAALELDGAREPLHATTPLSADATPAHDELAAAAEPRLHRQAKIAVNGGFRDFSN
jgi:hypothetical protein